MADDSAAKLESLRPTQRAAIMDVVAAAGIDVSKWAIKQDGSQVKEPKKNPNYCYEWAFGGGDEPTLLCVWHDSLANSEGAITYGENLRELALSLDRIAIDRSKPSNVRSRARDQAKRARNFDSLLQRAYRKSKPVRVVVLLGEARSEAELGWETSKVKYRLLDAVPWFVHSYSDDDGSFQVIRDLQPDNTVEVDSEVKETPELSEEPAFVDQFDVPEPLEKRDSSGTAYPRSQEVREAVLRRAGGLCECCGQPGFKMENGAVFLETHHVVPLSEKGPDVEWNVVALCPNDHRRAHYGVDRVELRESLLAKLLEVHPAAHEAIRKISVRSESERRQ